MTSQRRTKLWNSWTPSQVLGHSFQWEWEVTTSSKVMWPLQKPRRMGILQLPSTSRWCTVPSISMPKAECLTGSVTLQQIITNSRYQYQMVTNVTERTHQSNKKIVLAVTLAMNWAYLGKIFSPAPSLKLTLLPQKWVEGELMPRMILWISSCTVTRCLRTSGFRSWTNWYRIRRGGLSLG